MYSDFDPTMLLPCGMWGLMIFLQLFFAAVTIFLLVIWVLFILDAIKRDDKDYSMKNEKILWIVILVFARGLGTLLYYLLVYRRYGKAK